MHPSILAVLPILVSGAEYHISALRALPLSVLVNKLRWYQMWKVISQACCLRISFLSADLQRRVRGVPWSAPSAAVRAMQLPCIAAKLSDRSTSSWSLSWWRWHGWQRGGDAKAKHPNVSVPRLSRSLFTVARLQRKSHGINHLMPSYNAADYSCCCCCWHSRLHTCYSLFKKNVDVWLSIHCWL